MNSEIKRSSNMNTEINTSVYGDGDIPEIDFNRYKSQVTDVIPDEVPRRDGPGGN